MNFYIKFDNLKKFYFVFDHNYPRHFQRNPGENTSDNYNQQNNFVFSMFYKKRKNQ